MKRLWVMGTILMTALLLGPSSAKAGMSFWQWMGLGFGPGYHAPSASQHGHRGHGHRGHGHPTYAVHPRASQISPAMPSVTRTGSGVPGPVVPRPTVAPPRNGRPSAAAAPQSLPWRAR